MHRASVPAQQASQISSVPDTPAHQDRAYEFVECPMKAARGETGAMSDINPANMVRQGKLYLYTPFHTQMVALCALYRIRSQGNSYLVCYIKHQG